MPKFIKKLIGREPKANQRENKQFSGQIKIKDGVFEYGIKEIEMSKKEFQKFWNRMPKKKELKGKQFEDVELVEHLVVPPSVYSNSIIKNSLIKKSGLAQAESNVKRKFPWFKILETNIGELVIDKKGDGYVASLKLQGVCIDD